MQSPMNPPAPAAPPAAGAQPPDDQAAAPDMSAGYVIELRCAPGGKFSLGVEPMAVEQGEGEGVEGDGESGEYQSVQSLPEALKLIREIVAHGGEVADMTASQDEMSAGYGKGDM